MRSIQGMLAMHQVDPPAEAAGGWLCTLYREKHLILHNDEREDARVASTPHPLCPHRCAAGMLPPDITNATFRN